MEEKKEKKAEKEIKEATKEAAKEKKESKKIDGYVIPIDVFNRIVFIIGKSPSEISDGVYTFLKTLKPVKIDILNNEGGK